MDEVSGRQAAPGVGYAHALAPEVAPNSGFRTRISFKEARAFALGLADLFRLELDLLHSRVEHAGGASVAEGITAPDGLGYTAWVVAWLPAGAGGRE